MTADTLEHVLMVGGITLFLVGCAAARPRRLMASSSRSARYGRLWLRSMRSIILQMKA